MTGQSTSKGVVELKTIVRTKLESPGSALARTKREARA